MNLPLRDAKQFVLNRIESANTDTIFLPGGGGSIGNFPRIIKKRFKNTKRKSRPGFFCRRILFSSLLKNKK